MRRWRSDVKYYLIEIMGGKCQCCGYDKCSKALEFHHVDSSEKEHGVVFRNSGFRKVLDELKKCVLLCANCHREAHEYDIKYQSSYNSILAENYYEKYKKVATRKVDWEKVNLLDMKNSGLTNVAIAKMLGITEAMVRKRLKTLREPDETALGLHPSIDEV